jgi:hypothetical protein
MARATDYLWIDLERIENEKTSLIFLTVQIVTIIGMIEVDLIRGWLGNQQLCAAIAPPKLASKSSGLKNHQAGRTIFPLDNRRCQTIRREGRIR